MILSVCANPSVDSFWSVDWINKGITNRSNKESFYPGGKGIHVAFALKELGRDVTVLGIWGGQTGRWLKEQCAARDIAAIGPDLKEWTRICITMKSSSRWDQTELLGNGPTVKAHEAERFEALFQQFIEKSNPEAVVISGSVPSGFDPNIYSQLISLAGPLDIPCFIDATGPLLKQALKAKPFGVHINQHEGKELWGTDEPAQMACRLGAFCRVAAVTAGEKGLYLCVDGEIHHASCTLPSSKIISAVGSGDCLLAGLVAAISAGENPAYWAKYAAACGTANCIHPELGMLKSTDVDTIFEKVKLEKLKCDAE